MVERLTRTTKKCGLRTPVHNPQSKSLYSAQRQATNTRPGSMAMPLPTRAVMLKSGNILISDQFNDQVIEINPAKQIVFSQGKIQADGNGFNRLNAPYDAKVIGDYTGLTPPFGFAH